MKRTTANRTFGSITSLVGGVVLIFLYSLLLVPGQAQATNETATVGLQVTPAGNIYKEVRRTVAWGTTTLISTEDPSTYPLRRATLQMSPSIQFFPDPNKPVCPDNQIGPPPTNVSVPVDTAVARCPNSVIGNGTALFQLAGVNAPEAQAAGYIVIFNGGREPSGPLASRPTIKIYAFSYSTGVGIYTEGTLSGTGQIVFEVPRLSFDSAVTSLNLNIPGEVTPMTGDGVPPGSELPAGSQPNYVRASCPGSSWDLDGDFLLGNRDSGNTPIPPEVTVTDSDSIACVGLTGQARFGRISVSGPKKIRRGRKGTFRVRIPNVGTATARNVVLRVSGRGVFLKSRIGTIAPGQAKRVKVSPRFKRKGRVRVTFLVRASNASSKKVVRTVRVR